jgi:hypothetical protein
VTDLVAQMEPYIRRVGADYPNYLAWWSQNRDKDVDEVRADNFDFGLERLLDGLESWLEHTK